MAAKTTYNVIGSGDNWSCNTSNVVHLVTCQCCSLQYVGETSQALRKRMNNHRAKSKSLKPQFLYKQFTSDGHRLKDMFVQPTYWEHYNIAPDEQVSTYWTRKRTIQELKTACIVCHTAWMTTFVVFGNLQANDELSLEVRKLQGAQTKMTQPQTKKKEIALTLVIGL